MTGNSIYKDIAARTGGDIYIGVVGPVRTGKSTFIKKFMETLVIPNIKDEYKRERAQDELPQSSAGRMIMTTEPKFIPNQAAEVVIDGNARFNVRMIDCVGYIVDSAIGYIENDMPRQVMTPWDENSMDFCTAAELGTKKVICEHSTIGLVVTTDGSIGDIPRKDYEQAEKRIIDELKAINKPFIVLVNSMFPESESAKELADSLAKEYAVQTMCVNCLELDRGCILDILKNVLLEFPVKQINVDIPDWITSLDSGHPIKKEMFGKMLEYSKDIKCVREIEAFASGMQQCEYVDICSTMDIDLGCGTADVKVQLDSALYYKIISETAGVEIDGDNALIEFIKSMSAVKNKYDKINYAFEEAEATGYGIVNPGIEDLTLEQPEIFKQGNRFGVRLKAGAPSYHIIKANIKTEVAPLVGSEKQSEELVMYLMGDFEENPEKIWESNIFGKSVHDLVNEGLQAKLSKMPSDARVKLQDTLSKIINEGSGGLICIIL